MHFEAEWFLDWWFFLKNSRKSSWLKAIKGY
jgi:hypothetical protein